MICPGWDSECVVNERLRRAMLRAGYSVETLAEAAGVTGKSVQRWVAGEVTPFPAPGSGWPRS